MKRVKLYFIVPLITIYLIIEFSFLAANITKFAEGGYVTLFIALSLISVTIWYLERLIKLHKIVKIEDYKKVLVELSADLSIPKYART
jgi:KUP system potassium uptake protein